MGDDLIDLATSYIQNDEGTIWQPINLSPSNIFSARLANTIVYESPIQQYYNGLCNTEITVEQSEEIQKILKREKREEEKQKAINEFYKLTRVLEKCYR